MNRKTPIVSNATVNNKTQSQLCFVTYKLNRFIQLNNTEQLKFVLNPFICSEDLSYSKFSIRIHLKYVHKVNQWIEISLFLHHIFFITSAWFASAFGVHLPVTKKNYFSFKWLLQHVQSQRVKIIQNVMPTSMRNWLWRVCRKQIL